MDGVDVKNLRVLLGLTQKELADKIGVSVNTIQNYEKGTVIPAARQQLFVTLKELAISKIDVDSIESDGWGNFVAKEAGVNRGVIKGKMVPIAGNEGSINTGTVGGHNINVASPHLKKITPEGEITIEVARSIEDLQTEIAQLRAKVSQLEKEKDELNRALSKAKDKIIDLLEK